MKLRLILSVAVLLAIGFSPVMAQGLPGGVGGIELVPSIIYPAPGQTVTIALRSYSIDVNAANITWSVRGRVVEKGIGLTKIEVKAPDAGKSLTVSASAVSSDGTVYSSDLAISSGSIDIIIEPQGYAPPMFPGKAPVSYQNSVKIIAVPHLSNSAGTEYDPKTLVYKWEQGVNVLQEQSGYGKQSVILTGGLIPRPYQVTVTASTRDGSRQSMSTISIAPEIPQLFFYRNDPLYGPLYNHALGDTVYIGSQRETNVLAAPFGFNMPASGLGDLSLRWFVNGRERVELATNQSIILRAPADGSSGSSDIQLDIANSKDILQSASGAFKVVFAASTTTRQTY